VLSELPFHPRNMLPDQIWFLELIWAEHEEHELLKEWEAKTRTGHATPCWWCQVGRYTGFSYSSFHFPDVSPRVRKQGGIPLEISAKRRRSMESPYPQLFGESVLRTLLTSCLVQLRQQQGQGKLAANLSLEGILSLNLPGLPATFD
jgi:hypothetical protein